MYRKTCEVCGQPYKARRSTAKYCSGACNCVAYRRRNAARLAAERSVLSAEEYCDELVILSCINQEDGALQKLVSLVTHRNRPSLLRWVRYVVNAAYDNGKTDQLWMMVDADE